MTRNDERRRIFGHRVADVARGLTARADLLRQCAISGRAAPTDPTQGDVNPGEEWVLFREVKDLYKMEVFRLSGLRNRWKPNGALGPDGEVIPQNIIVKPPSAELRENQKDEDSLPPYPVLDGILHGLVEKEMRIADIVAEGYDPETVRRVERLLYLAEYKRRQSAPGVKVGPKNFGRDRRYPIVNRFRDPGLPRKSPTRRSRRQSRSAQRTVRGVETRELLPPRPGEGGPRPDGASPTAADAT